VSRVESILRRTARDLADLGCRWALVGGLAVSIRTEPRFTRDIDLVVAVANDAEAEFLAGALQGRGYRVQALVEQEATARLATTRLIPPGEDPAGVVLDLLFASSGIEAEIVDAAEVLEAFPAVHVPVASLAHLIALKVLSRDDRTRPQDRVDLVALGRTATAADFEEAGRAAGLIMRRGFGRGRDLLLAVGALAREG
jgi:predicted nucleotidyltransferase